MQFKQQIYIKYTFKKYKINRGAIKKSSELWRDRFKELSNRNNLTKLIKSYKKQFTRVA